MMLRIEKNKVKIGGAVILALLFCGCYVGMRFYSIPEKAGAVTWFPEEPNPGLKDITTMQEMTPDICRDSEIGDDNTLTDVRDDSTYTVAKLVDGKCWMTQNLRITRESIKTKDPTNTTGKITFIDSNVGITDAAGNNYEIPASITTSFNNAQDSNHYYPNEQVRAAATSEDGETSDPSGITSETGKIYGAYYSYNVATANTVKTLSSGISQYDICPKGWRLPEGGSGIGVNEFAVVAGLTSIEIVTNGNFWSSLSNPSLVNGALTVNGGSLAAAGSVIDIGLYNAGSGGYYWSNTIISSTSAHRLSFYNDNFSPAYDGSRYQGYSVRCVASPSEAIEQPTHTESVTGSIAVKVANTISIDAVSGTGDIEVDSTAVATGSISATVATNASSYRVLLSAEETSLKPKTSTNTAEIPAISPSPSTMTAGTNAWGIRNSDNITYSAITTSEKEYHNTNPTNTTSIPGIIHQYTVGISVSPSLPADTYSTDVTITAAAI